MERNVNESGIATIKQFIRKNSGCDARNRMPPKKSCLDTDSIYKIISTDTSAQKAVGDDHSFFVILFAFSVTLF